MSNKVRDIFHGWRERDLQWERDKRYSEDHKKAEREKDKQTTRALVLAEVKSQLGSAEKPGQLWRKYQATQAKVQKLQAAGPSGIDYARLNFELVRVRSRIATMRTVAEFEAWYNAGDTHQKMAAQALGTELASRFGQFKDSRTGSLLARLQADGEQMQNSPELLQARAELKEVGLEIRHLINDSELAAKAFGEKSGSFVLPGESEILEIVKEFSAPFDQVGEIGELGEIVRRAPDGGVVWPDSKAVQAGPGALIVPQIEAAGDQAAA